MAPQHACTTSPRRAAVAATTRENHGGMSHSPPAPHTARSGQESAAPWLQGRAEAVAISTSPSEQGFGLGIQGLAGGGLAPDGHETGDTQLLACLLNGIRPRLQAVLLPLFPRGRRRPLRHHLAPLVPRQLVLRQTRNR